MTGMVTGDCLTPEFRYRPERDTFGRRHSLCEAQPRHAVDMTDTAIIAGDPARDLELVTRARIGDADAFSMLVSDRLSRLLRTAKAIVGNVDDASEIVQETFVSAWVNLPRLRESGRFDAWLNRILTNRCRDALRRRSRSREIVLDVAELDDEGLSVPAAGISPISEAFAQLSVDSRHILLLHHVHDLPLMEIARLLDIPVGTAKSRLWAARRALERAMEAQS